MRLDGVVRDAAVLSAIGIGLDERRRVLGVSVALSEAEVHWRAFWKACRRAACGVSSMSFPTTTPVCVPRAFAIVARTNGATWLIVLGGAKWQRCQFHLAQNAIHHAPNLATRKRIGAELRAVWNASNLPKAETALTDLVTSYCDSAPKLAKWLEENVPEGLTVFALPEQHH